MKLHRNKKLLKYLDSTLIDSQLNIEQLLEEHFFNFQFEDNYGFRDYPNKGLIRKRIIELLFEIHDNWKIELDKLNKPYYLAIWLCEPQIISSDVVCAIDERINMYSNDWFDKSEKTNSLLKESYGNNQFERFTWERKKCMINIITVIIIGQKKIMLNLKITIKIKDILEGFYQNVKKQKRINMVKSTLEKLEMYGQELKNKCYKQPVSTNPELSLKHNFFKR